MALPAAARVFVSYTHDSTPHKARVLALAQRLRRDGVDAHLDAFEDAPPEGWPSWMEQQIRDAEYVIAVCTETYNRRATQRERDGVGLGARWEAGLITQAIYDAGGRNAKFVPVVFESSDIANIPAFLRATTRYDVSSEEGYLELFRRLTNQPSVIREPLQPLRKLRPISATGSERSLNTRPTNPKPNPSRQSTGARGVRTAAREVVLLDAGLGRLHFVPALSVQVGQQITLTLVPDAAPERVLLEELQARSTANIGIAFGLSAAYGRVLSITHTRVDSRDEFNLVIQPEAESMPLEMATTGYSADDIAVLRARRILLDERFNTRVGGLPGPAPQDSMLESLVVGTMTNWPVKRSPLPTLVKAFQGKARAAFLIAARLTVVYWLKRTGTIEHVLGLSIGFAGKNALSIRFHGQRRRAYSNHEPVEIRVEGTCSMG